MSPRTQSTVTPAERAFVAAISRERPLQANPVAWAPRVAVSRADSRARARAANGPVLEPMCGSGRFLLALLAAGIDVDGIDASAAMLDACRRHAAARGLAPSLHAAALERLALPRRYALAF